MGSYWQLEDGSWGAFGAGDGPGISTAGENEVMHFLLNLNLYLENKLF